MTRNWAVGRCLFLLLLMSSAWLAGCQTNPATGQKNFNVLSEDREVAIGSEAAPDFLNSYGGEIPDAGIRKYVKDLGTRLASASERPTLPWEFHPVNSDQVNAFALPGGKIFVTRGLMAMLKNEAELAGVLGHEIGHVTAQHIGQQMSQQMAVSVGLAGLGIATKQSNNAQYMQVLGSGAEIGSALYMLKFSRDDESQADELGVRYMSKLGYHPMAQVRVMQALKAAGGSGAGLEILSTHPYPETRIQRLTSHIQQNYPDYRNETMYRYDAKTYQAAVLDVLAKMAPAPKQTNDSSQGNSLRGRGRGTRR